MTATIRKRKKVQTPWSDSYCTPKWLADLLYETRGKPFDLDPCSNDRSHIRAHWAYSLDKHLDGRRLPWRGSVFENFEYSRPEVWCLKTIYEMLLGRCTEAVILCKLDPSTDWWKIATWWSGQVDFDFKSNALSEPPDIWVFDKRLQFEEPIEAIEERRRLIALAQAEGKKPPLLKTSNNFCSAIIHRRHFGEPMLYLNSVASMWELRSDAKINLSLPSVEQRLAHHLKLHERNQPTEDIQDAA